MEKPELINEFIHKALNPKEPTNGHTDSNSHFITLFSMCISLRAKRVLELGVRDGGTSMPLLTALSMTGGHLTSVDIQDTEFDCPKEFKDRWRFVKSDAIKFLSNIPKETQYDLIFIDDWHSFRHVRQEIKLLAPHVTKRSIILLHDLMWKSDPNYFTKRLPRNHQFGEGGPHRALEKLDKNKWEFATIPICHGLTILRKK